MKYLILAILLFTQTVFAECKPVSYIKEGQPACQTGYLFSPEMEEKARTSVEKFIIAQEIIIEQNQLIENQDKRIALETERYANIKAALESKNENVFWERVAWFAAGVVLTSGVVYVSNK